MLSCCIERDEAPDIKRHKSTITVNKALSQNHTQEESLELELGIVEDSISESEFDRLQALLSAVGDLDEHAACSKRPLNRQAQTLLRFLRGREGNVKAAEKMFRDSLDWRAAMDLDEKVNAWGQEFRACTTIRAQLVHKFSTDAKIGHDRYGVPVWLMRMGVSDPAGMVREFGREAILMHSLYMMESMHEELRVAMFRNSELVRGCIQIIDVGDYGKHGVENWWRRMWDGYSIGKDAFKIFDLNYPETTRKVFIVRMGTITHTIHKLCQPLIPPRTKRKMRVFGYCAASWREELESEMPPASSDLPKFLICDDESAFASALPKGGMVPTGFVPLCIGDETSSSKSSRGVRGPLFSEPLAKYFFALLIVLAVAIATPALARVDSSQAS